jgi:hypothetical protein
LQHINKQKKLEAQEKQEPIAEAVGSHWQLHGLHTTALPKMSQARQWPAAASSLQNFTYPAICSNN